MNLLEKFDEEFGINAPRGKTILAIDEQNVKDFLRKQISSLSFLRQLFAELPPDQTFTAKQLYEAIESFHPLMTKEQEQQFVDNLRDK